MGTRISRARSWPAAALLLALTARVAAQYGAWPGVVAALPFVAMTGLALGILARWEWPRALALGWLAREIAVLADGGPIEIVAGLCVVALLVAPWRRAERTCAGVAIAVLALAVNVAWFDGVWYGLAGLAPLALGFALWPRNRLATLG